MKKSDLISNDPVEAFELRIEKLETELRESKDMLANICQAAKMFPLADWPGDFKDSVFKAREWLYERSNK